MSATTEPPLDLQEQIARINRAITENSKLAEETRKFVSESHPLASEAQKLDADRRKTDRDRFLAPFAMVIAAMGAGAAILRGRHRLHTRTRSLRNTRCPSR